MQIRELLKLGEENLINAQEGRLKVKMLLSNLLGKNKEYLLIHENEELPEEIKEKFLVGIKALNEGKPIQYIIGKQSFYGLDFFVNKDVLIPQPDTEILVEEVIEIIKERIGKCDSYENIKILDLCTGSGAIAVALKKNLDNLKNKNSITMFASDISDKALEVAKINAKNNNTEINFIKSDLFENMKDLKEFDLIVSNPPYIRRNEIKKLSKEVQNEPEIALDGGIQGLDFYIKIIAEAKTYLKKDGILALEIGYDQKEDVIKIFEENKYNNIYSKKDFGGNDRIVIARA